MQTKHGEYHIPSLVVVVPDKGLDYSEALDFLGDQFNNPL
jgi:hypothetical protein